MAGVSIRNVKKNYGDVPVIRDLSVEIQAGEFLVFVGPSGCGKSTLLRMIGGLEGFEAGEIRINDKPVKVRLIGGEVDGKSIEFSEKERRASFRGGVHSLIYGEGAEPADALKPSR